ncbi:MAG: hypothetical protein KZQ89_18330 [Candidatus Thiodiazotropha sp. (ex Lucinoma kastoroae)]|nr:hypothetical protein [Candidatus Thiodiazotropha sp. (ex Rostrolucina anterorostrata)]MCU7849904.1 hypothetical protein [Candidatus Thiodiazotropha sp. (ex Lucinoma kastoroae)]MCU7858744.1 hypothetical protein [Candidatus Thiodiazotropha sp. (ex Lucinoma kastoroae)]
MHISHKHILCSIALFMVATISCNAIADQILINTKTPFAEHAQVREKVKKECQLDTKLPVFIKQFADSDDIQVALQTEPFDMNKGKVLMLEITNVVAQGGGAWSGAKSMSIAGKLYDSGNMIGDFKAMRYSGGGAFGGFKGTCSIVGRCSKALGKDVANWLRNPTKDAHLGDDS